MPTTVRPVRQLAPLAVVLALLVGTLARAADPAPRTLFNGVDLDGWDGDPRFWRVENGDLIGETTAEAKPEKNTFLIYRGGEFANFDLQFEYQVNGYNSGVQYRSAETGRWSMTGLQCDFEARHYKGDAGLIDRFSGMYFEEQGRMFLGQRGQCVIVRNNPANAKKPLIEVIGSVGEPAELEQVIHRDDWNAMRVIARGWQSTHLINGRVMSIGIDEDEPHRRAAGLIGFQLHAGPPMQIRIRNVNLRELSAAVRLRDCSRQMRGVHAALFVHPATNRTPVT